MPRALVRPTTAEDLPRIAEIYGHYVRTSVATFETEPPDEDELAGRLRALRDAGLPHLVAELDGAVVGFAYAAPWRARAAYRSVVEDSIYVSPAVARRGVGRALLAALLAACEAAGKRQVIAVIGGRDNSASIGLHAALGFREVGRLAAVGHKLDRWVDVVLMQRALGAGSGLPPSPEGGRPVR